MNDKYLMSLLAIGAIVWASTEGFGRLATVIGNARNKPVKLPKELIALVLGPVAAFVAHQAGFIQCGEKLPHIISILFFGLLCTMISAGGHQVGSRVLQALLPSGDGKKE